MDALLAKIRRKYKEYGINEKPFVVLKQAAEHSDGSSDGHGRLTLRECQGPGGA